MTKFSTKQTTATMRTLDKLWEPLREEDEDVLMEDKDQKTEAKMAPDNKRTPKTTSTTRDEPKRTTTKTQATLGTSNLIERFPMTLRFKIPSDSKIEANKKHMEILQSIAIHMKYCEIYSSKGDKTSLKPDSIDEFDYHEVKSRHHTAHVVVHRLVLDAKYHMIKKEQDIVNTLKHHRCQLQFHDWRVNEWDIINIGFISGCSPKHQSKDTVQHKMKLANKQQPAFNLHATTLKLESEGREYRTLAYEIQCPRNRYHEVSEYLATTCKLLDQTFIKYQWKHSSKTTFDNGIKKQITFIDSIRTIPIYGIHPIAMEILYSELIDDHDIIEINATNKTNSHGRWNIHVTDDNFETQTKWFQQNIEAVYEDKCKDIIEEVPRDYVPMVQFNSTITFQTKKPDPHLEVAEKSVCSYTNTSLSSRSWASVVSVSTTKPPQTISTITSTNELTNQLSQLSTTINKISDRLDKLEERMNKHDELIQKVQGFENTCLSHFQRLSDLIAKLEHRTDNISPRRLEIDFADNEPNKRRNINTTPTKDRNRD